ncbi:MAG: hypothetical protein WCA46_27090 [Actinocatenispora sp.]
MNSPTAPVEAEHVTAWYRLRFVERRLTAQITDPTGRHLADLRLLSSVDCLDGPDETVEVTGIAADTVDGGLRVTVTATSSRWESRRTVLHCAEDEITVRTTVTGTGRPTAVHLLGGWRPPSGFLPSGSGLRTVLSPNPDHPTRLARPAVEPATIGVVGEGGEPGVGRWLFTPAPWCFAVSRERRQSPERLPAGDWLALGIAPAAGGQNFTSLHYLPVTDGFSLRLDYEGQTEVSGTFEPPEVLLSFGSGDAYAALDRHRRALRRRALLPAERPGGPGWWREPLFCGWGAQCEVADREGARPQALATQQYYDDFLAALAGHGLHPGVITVDDKWQQRYATCRPDPEKWPDLRGWIAERHAAGQRVLLWWKAWDPEGAPLSACVRDATGRPVTLDPDAPDGQAVIEDAVRHMLSDDGLAADGLKVDFTARTPSGASLRHHGPRWGAELLHRQLEIVYRTAKSVRPDALVVTHAVNPAFADVTDMIRLNDALFTDAPDQRSWLADHMSFRGRVAAAACPQLPVDTDGWPMPDLCQWRSWRDAAPGFGVPSLYFVDSVGGEPMTEADYATLRDIWARVRRASRDRSPG